MLYANGDQYSGGWANGERSGVGKQQYECGDLYEGEVTKRSDTKLQPHAAHPHAGNACFTSGATTSDMAPESARSL